MWVRNWGIANWELRDFWQPSTGSEVQGSEVLGSPQTRLPSVGQGLSPAERDDGGQAMNATNSKMEEYHGKK